MINISALVSSEVGRIFSSPQHPQVCMAKIPDSRVAWLNQRALGWEADPVEFGDRAEQRKEHLLRACAYSITEDGGTEAVTGIADRYGGRGIASNGGSGRAAFLNGYYVKGVGRTPLIGLETQANHTTGGACLEECVRETIFSELANAEFPHGSVPTLGIIDIGVREVWQQSRLRRTERRCLLIRPCFLRPAHFERAAGFIGPDEKAGYLDRLRVEHMLRTATDLLGRDMFLAAYKRFWLAWAEQLAYAFIHRLPHGGDITSNIAFDGALVDFGAMTSVPTWARISLVLGPPVGGSMACLIDAIRAHAAVLGRYIDPAEATPKRVAEVAGLAAQRYQFVVWREMLRVAGLTRHQAELLLASDKGAELSSALGKIWSHFRRDHFAIFDRTPEPRIPWDVDQLWSENPPKYLRSLREFLMKYFRVFGGESSADRVLRGLAGRSAMRALTRPELFHEQAKRAVSKSLETDLVGSALNQQNLDRLISVTICRNRRDSKVEPEGAIPIGFARNGRWALALFCCLDTGLKFAVREWSAFGAVRRCDGETETLPDEETERLYIEKISADSISFASSTVPEFFGSVWLL